MLQLYILLQEFLELKKGCRVIHVINTNIYDNLVNGVSGTVVDFLWRKRSGADNSHVVAVLVQFDGPTVGQNLRRKHKGLHNSYIYSRWHSRHDLFHCISIYPELSKSHLGK